MTWIRVCSVLLAWGLCVELGEAQQCQPACVPPGDICLDYREAVTCVSPADSNSNCGCLWQTYIQRYDDNDDLLGTQEGTQCFEWSYTACEESKREELAEAAKITKLGDVVRTSQNIRESISKLNDPDEKRAATQKLLSILKSLEPLKTEVPRPFISRNPVRAEARQKATLKDLVSLALERENSDNPLRQFPDPDSDKDEMEDANVFLGEVDKTKGTNTAVVETDDTLDEDLEEGIAEGIEEQIAEELNEDDVVLDETTPGINMRIPTAPPSMVLSDEFRLCVLTAVIIFLLLSALVALMMNCWNQGEDLPPLMKGDLGCEQYGVHTAKNQFERFLARLNRQTEMKSLEEATKYYEAAQDHDLRQNYVKQFVKDADRPKHGNVYDSLMDPSSGGSSTAHENHQLMMAPEPDWPHYPKEPSHSPLLDAQILKTVLRQSGSQPGIPRKVKDSADNSLLISMPLNFKVPPARRGSTHP